MPAEPGGVRATRRVGNILGEYIGSEYFCGGMRRRDVRNVKGPGAFGRLSAKGATRLQPNGTSVKAMG